MSSTANTASNQRVIVKIGTSSITDESGALLPAAIERLCDEVAQMRAAGIEVVVVTSAAIAAGLPALGLSAEQRPTDSRTLQAVSAVGQIRLMAHYETALNAHGLVAGQVLLAPLDFSLRRQYLHARSTLTRLLELGVVPVVNENDAVADDEIRFGDNDRIAALVAQLMDADLLVLLTDTAGLLTADPRIDENATLIEEIVRFDRAVESLAGASGTSRGSGGMASKVAAAKMASWAGITTVIASSERPGVLRSAVAHEPGIGTIVRPRQRTVTARKLWIGFAVGSSGTIVVDAGARRALESDGRSLLAAGVVSVAGGFEAGDAVEITSPDGTVFAKGLAAQSSDAIVAVQGRRSGEISAELSSLVVHRDDLVILPE